MTEEKDKISEWVKRNPDIPYYVLVQFSGNCPTCGKRFFTDDGWKHWCIV